MIYIMTFYMNLAINSTFAGEFDIKELTIQSAQRWYFWTNYFVEICILETKKVHFILHQLKCWYMHLIFEIFKKPRYSSQRLHYQKGLCTHYISLHMDWHMIDVRTLCHTCIWFGSVPLCEIFLRWRMLFWYQFHFIETIWSYNHRFYMKWNHALLY